MTKTLVYLEKATVRGGIEIFAERHVARLRAEGREVEVAGSLPTDAAEFLAQFDEIVVHKCTDLKTLENFPPERTTLYVHDHDPICPRSYAYTPPDHPRCGIHPSFRDKKTLFFAKTI